MSTPDKSSKKLTESQQAILLLEEEIFEAVRSRDAGVLDRVLTNDFIYRSRDKEFSRDDFLELCAKFPYEITSIRGEYLKVNVYEDRLAVVTGLQYAKAKGDDGKEETSVVAFTDVFVKQKDKWMLSLAHAVDLPDAPDQRS
jgi:ketosteroid isomerase-like protein